MCNFPSNNPAPHFTEPRGWTIYDQVDYATSLTSFTQKQLWPHHFTNLKHLVKCYDNKNQHNLIIWKYLNDWNIKIWALL